MQRLTHTIAAFAGQTPPAPARAVPIDISSTRVNKPALVHFIFLRPPKSTERNSNKNLIYYWSESGPQFA